MLEEVKNIKSKKRELRNFGITLGIIFLVISGFLFWKEKDSLTLFIAISITWFFTAIVIPSVLKPVYWIWMIVGIVLGWLMTRVILSFLFYLVFTPIGLILRFFGKQFLELSWDNSKESYWNFRVNEEIKKGSYEKQF